LSALPVVCWRPSRAGVPAPHGLAPEMVQPSGNIHFTGCEPGAGVLASNLTPLPLASLNRGRDPQGSLGTVPWAGGTETAEGNWRETYKSRLAKRLARRLWDILSLRTPRRVFRHKQVHSNVLSSAAPRGARHSANRGFSQRTAAPDTLGVLDDEE
jgi:hypothetical protein